MLQQTRKIKTCEKRILKSWSEAGSQHCVTKSYMYIRKDNIYCAFMGIPVTYYFPYNLEILVNK